MVCPVLCQIRRHGSCWPTFFLCYLFLASSLPHPPPFVLKGGRNFLLLFSLAEENVIWKEVRSYLVGGWGAGQGTTGHGVARFGAHVGVPRYSEWIKQATDLTFKGLTGNKPAVMSHPHPQQQDLLIYSWGQESPGWNLTQKVAQTKEVLHGGGLPCPLPL